MDMTTLAGLMLITGLAAYMQTLAGFALGLIIMGAVGLTGILPLADAANLVSVLGIVNAVQVLRRGWRDIAMAQFVPIVVASLACLFVGYWLLGLMLSTSLTWLKLVLGVVIILSSLQLLMKPEPLAKLSSTASFVFFGAIAGLMSGLFSTAGPPLVYHLYRQPLKPASIRETLVAIFAINAVIRLATVAGTGNMPSPHFWWSLLTIPVVMLFTFLAKRWPPPISPVALRRLAFVLLFLSGASLGAPALITLTGGLS
ncbi:sulfite exporter TauE/SafE family protein [Allorhizobium sp. BGMRC 0089]|uniref:sulfite exporter TauE/SafE family protein n=1 Tax=Allorhizobium sonneratiae TaxID=2934936 RepID=UPI0020340D6B|nr:sulfite exporter TauE/SafE family protein [Allorhizobium sonneratiae]MCM2291021.1 sulfite exporter TauE/SafE family protein [Allorhizobium sonneratiae]